MEVVIWHSLLYRYASEVARSTQYIRLRPCVSVQQRVLTWTLDLPGTAVRMIDAFDNLTDVLTLDVPHQEIRLSAHGRVALRDGDSGEAAGRVNPRVFLRDTPLTQADEGLGAWLKGLGLATQTDARQALTELMAAVRARVLAAPTELGGVTAPSALAFARGKGSVCDQVHVFMAAARACGFPARYVSGYACNPDRTHWSLHSWSEVWLGDRWCRFDLNPEAVATPYYLSLATGVDELDACPVRGVRLGGGEVVVVSKARGGDAASFSATPV